jgi:hypothetical protein
LQHQVEALSSVTESALAESQLEGLNPVESEPFASPAPSDASFRAAFGNWLGGLGKEARELSLLLDREDAPEALRRFGAEALNQLLHAADLIPEGVEDVGYLETLFTFRVLARELCDAQPDAGAADPSGTLARLAGEAELIQAFLGAEDYARFGAVTRAYRERRTRDRSATDLVESPEARSAAVVEAQRWGEDYRPRAFGAGSHDLVRLLSFLRTRARRVS